MSHNIAVSSETFSRLKALAEPFIDQTPEDVIVRLLNHYNAHPAKEPTRPTARIPELEGRSYPPLDPPNLTHSKVISAYVDNELMDRSNWKRLRDELIRSMVKKTSFADLCKVSRSNIVRGKKEDEGYVYLSDIDLSVQGQDADGAWETTARLAHHLRIPVQVVFRWRNKEGIKYPGTIGRFSIE